MASEIECAVSGIIADAVAEFKDDGLAHLPPGWTQITFKRRTLNPKYMAIQTLKEAVVDNMLKAASAQGGDAEMQELAISLQVEASFAALEAKTPLYLTSVETVNIAPPDTDDGIKSVVDFLRENLSLTSLEDLGDDSDGDGEA
jgi:hypothetical protein